MKSPCDLCTKDTHLAYMCPLLITYNSRHWMAQVTCPPPQEPSFPKSVTAPNTQVP